MMKQDKNERIVDARKQIRNAGIFFMVMLLLEIPWSVVAQAIQNRIGEEYKYLVSILATQGYMLVAAIVFMVITGKRFVKDLNVHRYKPSTFFLSLVVLLTASPMATLLNVVSQFFDSNKTSAVIFSLTNQVPMWLGIIIVGCLPGFIEETIYRGILYTAFKKRSVLTGVLVSALSFGLMHMNFNQMLYAIYLGVIFALLVEATGSLLSTMLLHMLFNTINTSYLYLLPKLFEYSEKTLGTSQSLDLEKAIGQTPSKQFLISMTVGIFPFAIGGLILTVLLLRTIAKLNDRTFTWEFIIGDKEIIKGVKPVTICLVIGWLFCLLNAILAVINPT